MTPSFMLNAVQTQWLCCQVVLVSRKCIQWPFKMFYIFMQFWIDLNRIHGTRDVTPCVFVCSVYKLWEYPKRGECFSLSVICSVSEKALPYSCSRNLNKHFSWEFLSRVSSIGIEIRHYKGLCINVLKCQVMYRETLSHLNTLYRCYNMGWCSQFYGKHIFTKEYRLYVNLRCNLIILLKAEELLFKPGLVAKTSNQTIKKKCAHMQYDRDRLM